MIYFFYNQVLPDIRQNSFESGFEYPNKSHRFWFNLHNSESSLDEPFLKKPALICFQNIMGQTYAIALFKNYFTDFKKKLFY